MARKKYNNKSNIVSEWTTAKLIKTATNLHQSLYITECFASHDVQEYQCVISELESRGYEVNSHGSLLITKI